MPSIRLLVLSLCCLMLLSASVYAAKSDLKENATALERLGIDYFHVDCKNNPSVFDDIQTIRSVSAVPIDLHIIASEPFSFFDAIHANKVEQVAFQWEDITDKEAFIAQLPALSTQKGIAIVTTTPLPAKEVLQHFDFVLLMCTVPGESGGVFDKRNLERIIQLKHEHKHLGIHADGGVNDELAFILRLLGVDLVVSGSYLMNHELLASGMLNLLRTPGTTDTAKNIAVKDFMIPAKYLPVLPLGEITFKSALQTIEDYKQGFVLVENGKFQGVITNADIRRGLLKKMDALHEITAADLINTKPITIHEDAHLNELLKLIRHLNFIILFLPVINEQGKLTGAILLNNLTRA